MDHDGRPGRIAPPQRLGLLLAWHGAVTQTRMKHALGAAGLTPGTR